jgi:predicted DNA-binding transcriptional regulator YafY
VVLAVTFERPAHFDLATHWKSATAQLQQKRTQFQATLALAPDASVSLCRWCRVSPAPDVECTPALPAGWSVLHVSFENPDEARFIALGFGARVQVIAPATLRDQVHEEIRSAIARPALSFS